MIWSMKSVEICSVGSQLRKQLFSVTPSLSALLNAPAIACACVIGTPLGIAVLPDVNNMTAVSSASVSGVSIQGV